MIGLLGRETVQAVHYPMTPECHWETGQMDETLASYEDQPRQPSICLGHFLIGFGPHIPLYMLALSEGCEPKEHSLGYLLLYIWVDFTAMVPVVRG